MNKPYYPPKSNFDIVEYKNITTFMSVQPYAYSYLIRKISELGLPHLKVKKLKPHHLYNRFAIEMLTDNGTLCKVSINDDVEFYNFQMKYWFLTGDCIASYIIDKIDIKYYINLYFPPIYEEQSQASNE